MSLFVARLRAVGRRRGVLVLAVSLAVVAAVEAGVVAAGRSPHGIAVRPDGPVPRAPHPVGTGKRVIVGHSYKNDLSRPVRTLPRAARPLPGFHTEVSPNPRPASRHRNALDTVRQSTQFAPKMPSTTLHFDGIAFPGVGCNCAPPDTNGEVGATQYVQMVNQGFQVFDKNTGTPLTPATDIAALWSGFGGVCEFNGDGDPVVLYDQLAEPLADHASSPEIRVPTDECIAVSQTSDATGAWYRYGFHLGTDFFDYPHLGVWPDAYYMSDERLQPAGDGVPRLSAVRVRPGRDARRRGRRPSSPPALHLSSTRTLTRSFRPTWTARAPPPSWRAGAVPDVRAVQLDLAALPLPRRLRDAGELDVHTRGHAHTRRVHSAVRRPVDA